VENEDRDLPQRRRGAERERERDLILNSGTQEKHEPTMMHKDLEGGSSEILLLPNKGTRLFFLFFIPEFLSSILILCLL